MSEIRAAVPSRRRNTVDPRISVVVPAMNEGRNLEILLPELVATVDCHEVILIDGGSVDDTVATAQRVLPSIKVVHQTRKGKGNALAAGFAAVTGDIVIMFDADYSADPAEITRFVAALTEGADVAKGTRFTTGGGSVDITPIRAAGNWGLNLVFNTLFRSRYSDLCYGYNAFWADMIAVLDLPEHTTPAPADGSMVWGDGFEIETVIACRFAAASAAITEVPSHERLRAFGTSNLHAVKDGLRVLRTLMVEFARHRRTRTMSRRLTRDLSVTTAQPPVTAVPAVAAAGGASVTPLRTVTVANPRRTRSLEITRSA